MPRKKGLKREPFRPSAPIQEGEKIEQVGELNEDDFVHNVARLLESKETELPPEYLRQLEIETASLKDRTSKKQRAKDFFEKFLLLKNRDTFLPDTPTGEPFDEEGKIIFENEHAKIQLNNPDNVLSEKGTANNLISLVRQEAQKFRLSGNDQFKAKIVLDKNSFAMAIDPGKHKEFIGIFLPTKLKTPFILLYRFIPSGYEKSRQIKVRTEYIEKVMDKMNFYFWPELEKDKTESIRNIIAMKNLESFQQYVRLAQSVKDLDLALQSNDINFSAEMFRKGVVNMANFLKATLANDKKTQAVLVNNDLLLNSKEREILGEYFEYRNDFEEVKQEVQQKLEELSKARNLNYEIAQSLLQIGDTAREILGTPYESPQLAKKIQKEYGEVIEKLKEMAEKCEKVFGIVLSSQLKGMDINTLARKFQPPIDQFANIAKFGYGSEDALRHKDDTINISEEAMQRLPKNLQHALRDFQKIYQDKGTVLENWSRVESLEEALRFLHALLIQAPAAMRYYFGGAALDNVFYRPHPLENLMDVIDVSKNGVSHSPAVECIMKTLERLGTRAKRNFQSRDSGDFTKGIVGDTYGEFMSRAGKHYVEWSTQTSGEEEKQKEYSIAFRYLESGYAGAIERQDFVFGILKTLGYDVRRERDLRGWLNAEFRTLEKKEWEEIFSETSRLIVAMRNLDLDFHFGADAQDFFHNGVVTFFNDFRKVRHFLENDLKPTQELCYDLYNIFQVGSEYEKRFLAELFLKYGITTKEKFLPFCVELDAGQKNELVNLMAEIAKEDLVNGRGDAQYLKNIQNLLKLI